jgi:hypothetical protein
MMARDATMRDRPAEEGPELGLHCRRTELLLAAGLVAVVIVALAVLLGSGLAGVLRPG